MSKITWFKSLSLLAFFSLCLALMPNQSKVSAVVNQWNDVGNAGFTNGKISASSIDFSPTNNDIYVLYGHDAISPTGTYPEVRYYNGSSWIYIGSPLSTGYATPYCDQLAVSSTGVPYVVTNSNSFGGRIEVAKYDGSFWDTSWGPSNTFLISAGDALNATIKFNPATNEPFIAYTEYYNSSYKVTVMKFDGTNWVYVGSQGFSTSYNLSTISLSFNPSTNEPYIAFYNSVDGKVNVMKFNGSSWVDVYSSSLASAGSVSDISLSFNPMTNEPYVAYSGFGIKVAYLHNNVWTYINGTSLTNESYVSMDFYNNSSVGAVAPYVVYKNIVKRYMGVSDGWSQLGSEITSNSEITKASYSVIKFNPITREPYVFFADNGLNSGWGRVVRYAFNSVATPTASFAGGTYSGAQSISLSSTSGANIYYTTNGSTPTASSTLYAGAISLSQSTTLKAIAIKSEMANSDIMSEAYIINVATPVASPDAGTYTSAQSVTLSTTTSGATIYYTIDGSTPTASSTLYGGAISVATTETIKAIAVKSGMSNSDVMSKTYTINLPGQVATPSASPVGGTYTSFQSVKLSDATSGATIYYTTDGTTPTTGSKKYSDDIAVNASQTIKAIATKSGMITSGTLTAVYTINLLSAATPTVSPSAGTYTSYQSVTLSTTTSGASIYYTTNGSTPTASSTKYSGAIAVISSQIIKAIAVKTGMNNSDVMTASYTINIPTPNSGPVAVTGNSITNQTAVSASVNLTTGINSTCSVVFGTKVKTKTKKVKVGKKTVKIKTTAITGARTVSDANSATSHTLNLTGLKKNKVYYYQITTQNGSDSTKTTILKFKTLKK